MQCLYCKTPLAPLRALNHSQFCSDDHELTQWVEQSDSQCLFLYAQPPPAGPEPRAASPGPIHFQPEIAGPNLSPRPGLRDEPDAVADWKPLHLLPEPVQPEPEGLAPQPAPGVPRPNLPALPVKVAGAVSARVQPWWRLPSTLWRVGLAMLPIIAAAAYTSFTKPVPGASPRPRTLLASPLDQVRDSIRSRAAVDLTEDFRDGLGSWTSRANVRKSWAQDSKGFVRPGVLALYRPTLGLKNYSFEIVTQLEQKALGAAYRVQDWDHYYAVRLRLAKPNPGARIEIVRYSVVDGREIGGVARSLPVQLNTISAHHVRLEAHESEFALFWDGKLVDEWSDGRYPDGGVGLFSGNGERARVLWLEVSKQHDLLGRFCALLTPDGQKASGRE